MLFSSLVFLLLFLPIVLFVYYVFPNRTYRNGILLIVSLVFYGWAEPKLILLMMSMLLINYTMALILDQFEGKKRSALFLVTLILDLGTLFYFKYFNFTLSNINRLFGTNFVSNVVLPIGISFYLFQVLSYVIDVYWKKVKVQKSFLLLSTYIALFPQLVAGPIVRYETIEEQLLQREESWDHFYEGVKRFLVGLGKKVIISNNVAIVSNLVFVETPAANLNFTLAWIGAIAYTLQIYFDFGGYSDMAIGLGKMFGFDFLENFNYPYIAGSITDFWRRWHISLSTWFRDYIYIPLGGNRKGLKRQLINIFVVWALTGLWHGAAWNFVLWGLYFAVILIIEKTFLLKLFNKMPSFIRHLYSLLLIVFGWVIFNSSSLSQVVVMVKTMLLPKGMMSLAEIKNLRILYLWPYFAIGLIASTPVLSLLQRRLEKSKLGNLIVHGVLLLVLFWCIVLLMNNSYNPFIYYRF
ncbi:MAG: MBOAT family protein [Erysipelotrichaceae bacterium]|nr:MBOAT family protein [Erysipelotrichaceae bacterium]